MAIIVTGGVGVIEETFINYNLKVHPEDIGKKMGVGGESENFGTCDDSPLSRSTVKDESWR